MSAYDDVIAEILKQETDSTGRSSRGGRELNSPIPYANRPWVEFVMGQMLLLFSAEGREPSATTEASH